uniref:Isoform 2 of Protein OPAQUE10 n=1 Tax=Zea mays TaxID=4577 RepID=P0DKL2-2
MSLHAARGGPHEDLSWSAIGRRAPRDVVTFGDREGGGGMRSAQQGPGAVRVDEASSASTFRELDEAFLQTQTKIWLGEVLHLRFGEDALVADLLADGELLFQVSKVLWKMLLKNNREQLKQSKVYIYERLSFGRSSGKYMPYSKVDSFLKICQILGLAGIDLFTPSDVVEKRNVRKVCICIRSVSKKSLILHLNVPDFDVVTYTISMPNYVVGGIRRNLEQTQYSSSSSSGYSPCARSKVLQQQIIFGGQNDQHEDTHYDSDEAESKLSLLEPEDSVNEDNFAAVLSQFNDAHAPNKESEGYGESGRGKHGEKSLAESVGSLNIGIIDSEFMDSSPLIHDKESCFPLEPEGSVNEDNFTAVLSQFNDAPNKESEGYGESGCGKHGEKSLVESVGSLNIGIVDSEFMDSSPLIHDKESCSPLEPEDSVNEDNFTAVLSQFNDAPNKESEAYGESGCGKHGENSLDESVGSLNIGVIDSEFMDSSPLIHDKESCSPLEPEDSVNEDNFAAVLSQYSDGPNEGNEGYGESGHYKHEEKSLDESVGSLTIGIIDSEFMDSSRPIHDKESCSTGSAADQCSRTIPAKYELSSEESDSTGSHLVFDSGKNYLELNNHSVTDLERIYNGHATSVDQYVRGNGETLADHPKKEEAGLQKDTGTIAQHRDTLACDGESVCSSCEEPRRGLNGEPSDFSSESHSRLTPTHNTGGKLSMVSEHPVHNMESDMTGMASDSTNPELNPEASTRNEMDGSRSTDNPVEPENVAQDSATRGRPEGDAPRSGKGVLRSVAGGITLVGAVFFMFHLSAALLQKKQGGKLCDGHTISFGKICSEQRKGQEHGQRKRP